MRDIGSSNFGVMFPSHAELKHMIEWGVVQMKFNAKMQIERQEEGNDIKYVMPKVWVQFTGLPLELREFEVIWAAGHCPRP